MYINATRMYWPKKAAALGELGRRSIRLPIIQALAASLALAGLPAWQAADRIRGAVAERVAYRLERGDHYWTADRVLAAGVEDCDGHAVVGAALAGAAGFGARIVGVSLPGESQPAHVRAEISADGRTWWPADSTPTPIDIAVDYHAPAAHVAHPGPQAVGFLGFDVPIVDDLIDAGLDIVGGVLDAVGLDEVSDWLTSNAREMLNDPRWLATALAVAGTCIGAPALCPVALSAAKGMVVAEGVRRFGPQHWERLAMAEIVDAAKGIQREERIAAPQWEVAEDIAALELAEHAPAALAARLRGSVRTETAWRGWEIGRSYVLPLRLSSAHSNPTALARLAGTASAAVQRNTLARVAATGWKPKKTNGGLLVGLLALAGWRLKGKA